MDLEHFFLLMKTYFDNEESYHYGIAKLNDESFSSVLVTNGHETIIIKPTEFKIINDVFYLVDHLDAHWLFQTIEFICL